MPRLEDTKQVPLMSLNRFEAFSDGVFAIAVTLLVLALKAPDLSQATPSEAVTKLLQVFPHVLSYATSFIVIGVLWINHALWFYVVHRYIRSEKLIHQKAVQKATIWSLSYPISYLVAAGLAFITINLSIVLYVLIPSFYLLPGIIDKQLIEQV